jgi:hypothetical protein
VEHNQLTMRNDAFFFRFKVVEFLDIGVSMALPKPVTLTHVAIRVCQYHGMTATFEYDSAQPQRMVPTGMIMSFELLELPEPAKNVNGWTIRPGKMARPEAGSQTRLR